MNICNIEKAWHKFISKCTVFIGELGTERKTSSFSESEVQSRCRMEEENQEKCIRQFVLSVARNVKFRSNLTEADPYTAENAMQREETQGEDIKLTG